MVQNNSNLKSLIDKLWNNFWSSGISNPLTAIEQITYLIFMKRLDDLEVKRERDAEFTGEKYTSRFNGKFNIPGSDQTIDKNELRWSVFKHMPAENMLFHIQTKVFPFLKELNGKASPFTKHMANAVFIMPKASLLVEAINIIEQIFIEIEKDAIEGGHAFQDIQGDVYEMLLSEITTSGKNGQFRTPRHIIKLMAELVAPQLGQRIGDPVHQKTGKKPDLVIADVITRLEAFAPEMREYISQVKRHKPRSWRHHLKSLLSMKVNYRVEDILVAVRRAQQYKVFESGAIERFLTNNSEPRYSIKLSFIPNKDPGYEQ